jgi:hypothetical protein
MDCCYAPGMNTMTRTWSERSLRFLLRYIGGVALLALVAVFMPYTWMNSIHSALEMGTLPAEPIVGYLARSLSLFYALLGGLLVVYSFNPHRYRTAICYLGAAFVFFGIVMLGVDFSEGMPGFWKTAEGPIDIGFGILILMLAIRLRPLVNENRGD